MVELIKVFTRTSRSKFPSDDLKFFLKLDKMVQEKRIAPGDDVVAESTESPSVVSKKPKQSADGNDSAKPKAFSKRDNKNT